MTLGSDHYIPLLRAKQGELQALEMASPIVRGRMTPLVDVLSEDADNGQQDIDRLVSRLKDGWGANDRVIVDINSLGDATGPNGDHLVRYLCEISRTAGLSAVPAAWLASSAAFIAEVANAAAADGCGACLRITTNDLQDPAQMALDIQTTLVDLSLPAADVDLIIDMGLVDANTIGLHAALLSVVLPALPFLPDWRSLTLAAGAFPLNLDAFSSYIPGTTPRYDAQLWRRLAARTLTRTPGFGDYGVTHPVAVAAGPWRGAPNLRYTLADDWYVIKGSTRSPRGNYDFHDLCNQVAASTPNPLRPAGFSWGDTEIRRCATGVGGPGGGTQWRAWATSHHLAEVTERLATLGEP